MRPLAPLALALAAILSAAVGLPAAAQSALPAAEAADFLGEWRSTLDTPEGPVPTTVRVADAEGRVALRVDFEGLGEVPVTDVARRGAGLLARFSVDYQGSQIPVELTLTPSGDAMRANWSFADGEYTLTTTATRG